MNGKSIAHWDRYAIRAEIQRRGTTLPALAEKYGVPASSLRVTLARERPVVAADLVISDFLNVPLHELWPDRYDAKGNRLVRVGTLKTLRRRRKRRRSAQS